MDPFEDVMTTMRVASSLYVRLQLRAPYGVRFDTRDQARLVVIARGSCWLVADDLPQPTPLAAGDCLIVKAGTEFCLQDELGRKLVPCEKVLSKITGRTVQHGGKGVLMEMISGALSFDAAAAEPLMALMPCLIHVRLDQAHAHLLQTTLQLIGLETSEDGLGANLVIGRLADVLFVQAVRAWCGAEQQAVGWLAGLKDRRLAAAIRAMHGDLARPWTVEMLAREAGLSRSAFAATFKAVTGDTPAGLPDWLADLPRKGPAPRQRTELDGDRGACRVRDRYRAEPCVPPLRGHRARRVASPWPFWSIRLEATRARTDHFGSAPREVAAVLVFESSIEDTRVAVRSS